MTTSASGEQFSERFESEAKAIAALNHPNTCQIYDVGPDFLVMEYIDGRPIIDCEQPQALPPNEALQLARQIAAALETVSAHSWVAPYNFAVIHAGLGHKDQAFALLNQAYKDRSYYLPTYLATDARMDSLRSDPRFGELNRRVGLPE